LLAYGTSEDDVIFGDYTTPSGDAVIAARNQEAGNTNYEAFTKDDIVSLPATAVWFNKNGKSGILANNGTNTNFAELDVAVNLSGGSYCVFDFDFRLCVPMGYFELPYFADGYTCHDLDGIIEDSCPANYVVYDYYDDYEDAGGSSSSSSTTIVSGSSSSTGVIEPTSSSSGKGDVTYTNHLFVTRNYVTQIANGISLSVKNSAVVGIYSLKGNLISRQNYASGNHLVSLKNLPKGMYIVKVSFGSGIPVKILKATVTH